MKFHTQLKANDIFKFSLAYTYSGLQLILAIAMVAVGVYMCVTGMGAADGQSNMIFGIVLIVLFVVVNPLMLYVKAKKQAIENPVYKMKTYYTLNEDGIFVELGEDSATIEWARVLKISHVMGLNILYTGRKQAFVFPDYALGEDKDKMLSYMKNRRRNYKMIVQSFCAEDTYEIGKKIGQEAVPGQVICLYGNLGVGKTVFTKGLADGLGITEPIQSPTFTIVREYEEGRLPLYHFDVYRIGDIEEMDEIGYEDYVYGEGVCLIEWANLIEEILPDHYQKITIRKDLEKGFDYREIEMEEQ